MAGKLYLALLAAFALWTVPSIGMAEEVGTAQKAPGQEMPGAVVVLSADGPGALDLKVGEWLGYKTKDYVVALVYFGPKPAVKIAEGLVVRTQEGWSVLQLRYHALLRKTEHGEVQELWANLFANKLGGGEESWTLLETTLSDVPGPEPDSVTQTFTSEGAIELTSLLEGHVSYSVYISTFEGGAHNFDSSQVLTRHVQTQAKLAIQGEAVAFLKPLALAELNRVNQQRKAEDMEPIEPEEKELFENGAIAVDWAEGKLQYRTVLYCCSWAENHNMYELMVDLPELKGDLAALAPPKVVSPNLVEGPMEQLVGLDGSGRLVAGKKGALEVLESPGFKLHGILGVYWLKPGETLDLTRLPKPVLQEQP